MVQGVFFGYTGEWNLGSSNYTTPCELKYEMWDCRGAGNPSCRSLNVEATLATPEQMEWITLNPHLSDLRDCHPTSPRPT